MWEKKSSGMFVKKTEKAVRKLADKKTELIEQTSDWMRRYQYAEWPKNPDKLEQEMKQKTLDPQSMSRLKSYIKQMKKAGYAQDQIKINLLKEGWSTSIINDIFKGTK